jgi:peptidoglycan/LPS O-acetylase OafA/YrhL
MNTVAHRGEAQLSPALVTSKSHRRDIDGLRAIAVLSVLGFHCNIPWLSGGFVGVDIFFVISGYLICGIIGRDIQKGRFSISGFYERRFKRILPALLAVLLFCFVCGAAILSPIEFHTFGITSAAAVTSISNLYFFKRGNYFMADAALNPLLMTWSLAVEEQFYIAFPLLMLLLSKSKRIRPFTILLLLSSLSLALSIRSEFHYPEFNFYLPFTRAWELGAGAMLALWEAERRPHFKLPAAASHILSLAGLAGVLACICFYSQAIRFPGYEALPPVLAAVLLLATPGGIGNRVLAIQPFVGIGLISYSLYLWHWPLLSFARILLPGQIPLSTCAMLMAIALLIAIGSYRFIEQPFRTHAYRSTSHVLWTYGGAIALFAVVGALIYVDHGIPQRVPPLAGIETRAAVETHHPCMAFDETPRFALECAPPPSSKPAIALLGDSHAEAMFYGVKQLASDSGYNLVTLTRGHCPPLSGYTHAIPVLRTNAQSCALFNERVLSYVLSRQDIKEVFLVGRWLDTVDRFVPNGSKEPLSAISFEQSAENLKQGLIAEIRALQAADKHVVLMDDIPTLPFDAMQVARYDYMPIRRAATELLLRGALPHASVDGSGRNAVSKDEISAELDNPFSRQVRSIQREIPSVDFFDPKEALCNADSCAFGDQSDFFYADNEHLSRMGALVAISVYRKNFGQPQGK